MKPDLIRHLQGENLGRFPVWMMRQAGRYLPSYRRIREKYSFWESVVNPDLAVEISLLPLRELPVDGVILFSDILTMPYGLGLPVEMKESVGPVITSPLRSAQAFGVFANYHPEEHTNFVGTALKTLAKELKPETALIGFAGAPWTVACYLIEGQGKTHFETIKKWLVEDPETLATALNSLADATISYLKYQHECGVHIAQLFDTWIVEMPVGFFNQYYVPTLNRMFRELSHFPMIYFSKRNHHLLPDYHRLEVPTLSVDELLPLTEFERRTQGKFSLQGNLDPCLLFGETATVRRETRRLVAEARKLAKPAIMNLGHGIMPKVPVENARAFLEEARERWI